MKREKFEILVLLGGLLLFSAALGTFWGNKSTCKHKIALADSDRAL